MLCRKFVKKAICLLMVLTFALGGFNGIKFMPKAKAESISEMQDEISGLESQKSTLKNRIDSLQGKVDEQQEYLDTLNSYISAVESKIMTCENILASYQAEIDELNSEIDKKEEELNHNKDLFKRRICSLYMSDTTSPLLILLGSEYFADYLSMSQFTECLAKYDNALMTKINNTMDDIGKKIDKKNDAMSEQQAVKDELATERADLQSKQSEASNVLSSISKSKNDLQAELDSVNSSIASLEGNIDAAYEAARQAALNNQSSVHYDGNGFAWPLPGYSTITSPFGNRFDPYYQCYRGHNGIDISGGGVAGKPIVASAAGTVTVAEFNTGGYGNYVVLSHGYVDGSLITTHYGHMMSYCVSIGQTVNQGDVIGYVGTTGASTGYHLHFEVRVNNAPTDPFGFVSY